MQCLRLLRHSKAQTKSIVFGTNHSLSAKPQLNLVMNGMAVEQVEETKLLVVTLDCKLSWSKHIDSMVVKMGRCLGRNKEILCIFDNTLHKASPAGTSFI